MAIPAPVDVHARFQRLGVALAPEPSAAAQQVLNPASARLRDGSLQLYPRMVAPGNISSIGSYRVSEPEDGALCFEQQGYALEPEAPYELRAVAGGYGCEDPRVTFIGAIDRYVMAYTAFGPRGPEVAVAVSQDGLQWRRLGLMCFGGSDAPFAVKDAAFFPEPVLSPAGVRSLAFYHRPTIWPPMSPAVAAGGRDEYESLAIGYVSLEAALADVSSLRDTVESHRLELPPAQWGRIKVGAGTPPVRIREGWLSVIHGIDLVERPGRAAYARYCAGIIVHDIDRLDRIVYRSPSPLFVPRAEAEVHGTVSHVVFPTAIDHHPDWDARTFDIYYGMGDDEIGRGRLTLGWANPGP